MIVSHSFRLAVGGGFLAFAAALWLWPLAQSYLALPAFLRRRRRARR